MKRGVLYNALLDWRGVPGWQATVDLQENQLLANHQTTKSLDLLQVRDALYLSHSSAIPSANLFGGGEQASHSRANAF